MKLDAHFNLTYRFIQPFVVIKCWKKYRFIFIWTNFLTLINCKSAFIFNRKLSLELPPNSFQSFIENRFTKKVNKFDTQWNQFKLTKSFYFPSTFFTQRWFKATENCGFCIRVLQSLVTPTVCLTPLLFCEVKFQIQQILN